MPIFIQTLICIIAAFMLLSFLTLISRILEEKRIARERDFCLKEKELQLRERELKLKENKLTPNDFD